MLAGDFNVIPEPDDARYPENWTERRPVPARDPRAPTAGYLNLGLTDAFRACYAEHGVYTFWDYQAGAWQKNNGIRIDHQLLSPLAADRLVGPGSTASLAPGKSRRITSPSGSNCRLNLHQSPTSKSTSGP